MSTAHPLKCFNNSVCKLKIFSRTRKCQQCGRGDDIIARQVLMSVKEAVPSIEFNSAEKVMTIQIDSPLPFEKYKGSYSYESLPIQFKVLFENIQELYAFLTHHTQERLTIKDGTLHVSVNIVGKNKDFSLPLYQIELSPEEQLHKKIYDLELLIQAQNQDLLSLQLRLDARGGEKLEREKVIDMMSELIKQKESENRKLLGRLRLMEGQVEDYVEEEKGGKEEHQLRESPMTEEFTPMKRMSAKSRKLKQLEDYGKKMAFKLDEGAKHYTKFKSAMSEVEKLHGPTYQLFHLEPLPKEGKYFFDLRIILIKNNNIVVGIITDKNKDEQFSFKRINCVCYNGYDGSICEQDKQKYVNIKPKEGNKIRTVIDMAAGSISWFIMGSEVAKTTIGTATIPPSMLKQPLYPYFELYWEGNKIRLNS